MSPRKKFSIALPVRNGGEHLKLCVASILAQTLADEFELLILENASTDGTAEWIGNLRDPRVRLYPAERPLSIEENWARIKDLPKGEFITTIGHDDLLDPNFLEVIAGLIRDHPDATLYSTHFRIIVGSGALLRHCRPIPGRETAAEFVAARLSNLRDSFGTGHVLRSTTYDALGGIPPYLKLLYADDALFVQAIGTSYQATALDEAFSYRWHASNTSATCARGDLFAGLEQYSQLLLRLREEDPALAEVLRRYFREYVVAEGRLWKYEALLAAYHGHTSPNPELDRRVTDLTRLAGDVSGLPLTPEPGEIRFLEYATRSRPVSALYALFDATRRARQPAIRIFSRALKALGAGNT